MKTPWASPLTLTTLTTLTVLTAPSLNSAQAAPGFACELAALSREERVHHRQLTDQLLAAVVERVELKHGYGFRLPSSSLPLVAEWAGLESRCCPFFDFELALAKDHGPLWLRITGAEGIKAFLRAEFGSDDQRHGKTTTRPL